jgi:uncharacterized membrane-anchored protein
MKTMQLAAGLLAIVLGFIDTASAQATKRDQQAEMAAAVEAAQKVAQKGPRDISLKDQATLKLPAGYEFIPQPEANQLMKAMGNGTDDSRVGLIFPPEGQRGFVVAKYIHSGYVKDDEARDWKSDEMLQQMKDGTEAGNQERAELGISAIEVVGWVQPPKYDDKDHRLVWSVESKEKNAAAGDQHGINYNTFVLGREGYISLNLVTSLSTIEQDKAVAITLLSDTSFNDGKRYADFNASTDKVAEYGIAALVAGVAAKKLGLFAIIAAFAVKFAKVIALAAFGLFAALRSFFKRKKNVATTNHQDNQGA